MSKVTGKLQVTIPKAIADRFSIRPGDEIEWEVRGNVLRVVPPGRRSLELDLDEKLRLFDEATERQRERQAGSAYPIAEVRDRGWTREELYERGGSR